MTGKTQVTVEARSRGEAFDKLRDLEVKYATRLKGRVVVGRGVQHKPRLTR